MTAGDVEADFLPKPCLECGTVFTPRIRKPTLFCTRACKDARRRRLLREERLAAKASTPRTCVVCGTVLPPEFRANRRYCSDRCIRLARRHTGNAQRRLRVPDLAEPISRAAVYDRDGWVCQLCGEPVDPELEYPDPMAASLDHVVPMSRGGTNASTNLQLAHLVCNVSAHDIKANLTPRPAVVIDGKDYYRVPEAAEMIGTTKAILDRAIRTGRVPVFQPNGWRYLSAQTVAELQAAGLMDGRQHRSKMVQEAQEQRRIARRRACLTCGITFDYPNPANRRKFCSDPCYRASKNERRRLTDEEKARPKRTWEQPCTTCGKPIIVSEDRPRRYSCSPACARQRKQARALERNPPQRTTCAVCEAPLPPRTRPGRMSATCSDACREEWPRLRTRRWHAARRTK
jgi:predicted nucleic acid-binding Zn ribbon protein